MEPEASSLSLEVSATWERCFSNLRTGRRFLFPLFSCSCILCSLGKFDACGPAIQTWFTFSSSCIQGLVHRSSLHICFSHPCPFRMFLQSFASLFPLLCALPAEFQAGSPSSQLQVHFSISILGLSICHNPPFTFTFSRLMLFIWFSVHAFHCPVFSSATENAATFLGFILGRVS